MPKLRHSQPYKGTFIGEQTLYWLDLPLRKQQIGLEPEIFRLADLLTDAAEADTLGEPSLPTLQPGILNTCRQFRLKQNPWKEVSRYDVLHRGQRPDGASWQRLCITVGAGTGKTMAAEQTEYLLAEADSQSLNIFIEFNNIPSSVSEILSPGIESTSTSSGTPLLIQELQKLSVNGQTMSDRVARELLQQKIGSGKFTLVVDAIDQYRGQIPEARASARALRDFLQRYPKVRCVITGRPYAVKRFQTELFDVLDWDIVQLGRFTESQVERRIGNAKKTAWIKRQGKLNAGIPRWIDVLINVHEDDLGDDIKTLSDLYLLSLESLMAEARDKQLDALDEDCAWYLFALLAFEMVTDPDGPFRGQGSGVNSDNIGPFKQRVWDTRKIPINPANLKEGYRFPGLDDIEFADLAAFKQTLGQLGALNEMLDDPVIAGNDDDPYKLTQIFWRDQTLQDMFAALWMTRWATEGDVDKLRDRLYVRWQEDTTGYEDMWRLATEMPFVKRGRKNDAYVRTMSVLYEPSTPERPAVRSTEMIWRSWPHMQELREGGDQEAIRIHNEWLGEFEQILNGDQGSDRQQAAKEFQDDLLLIPAGEFKMGSPPDKGPQMPDDNRDYWTDWHARTQEDGADVVELVDQVISDHRIQPRYREAWSDFLTELAGLPIEEVLERLRLQFYPSNETPVSRTQTIESSFLLGRSPIINSWLRLFMREDGALGEHADYQDFSAEDNHPAIYIDWYSAWCFCEWAHWQGQSCRLPWENEWEYAAKYGTPWDHRYWWGDDWDKTRATGNQEPNHTTLPTRAHASAATRGLDKDRGDGLMDMLGNVWEWCQDHYREEYERTSGDSPGGQELFRCLRGGSFFGFPEFCRSALRNWYLAGYSFHFVGVRVSRVAMK